MARLTRGVVRCPGRAAADNSSQRLQILHQVSLLLHRKTEAPNAVDQDGKNTALVP